MQMPLQITFRDFEPSPYVEAAIREKADKLERIFEPIMGCRVVVETPHRHRSKGKLFHIRIDLRVPNGELVVSREPHKNHAHEDVYVAIRDAFEAARRQLEEFRDRQKIVPSRERTNGALADSGPGGTVAAGSMDGDSEWDRGIDTASETAIESAIEAESDFVPAAGGPGAGPVPGVAAGKA